MEFTPLGIDGAWVATSKLHADERGNFREWFKRSEIREKTGIDFQVEQSNVSSSNRGVIRGIHYSLVDGGQSKWVTCVNGRIIDFVVDIRPNSPTYLKSEAVELSEGRATAVFVGPGLGHGFIALEDGSTVSYLLSSPYSPENEFEINPMDADLRINWRLDLLGNMGIILSPKDADAPSLVDRQAEGKLPR